MLESNIKQDMRAYKMKGFKIQGCQFYTALVAILSHNVTLSGNKSPWNWAAGIEKYKC